MSVYYNYYLGEKKKDGKIYPLGPYDRDGELCYALSTSGSLCSRLHEEFGDIKKDEISDELRKRFESKDWNGEPSVNLWVLGLDELPKGSYIREGYFLIDDIKKYAEDRDDFDLFYDSMTPIEYAMKTEAELKFGPPKARKDDFGTEYTPHSVSEYAYFAYPDYESKEYEASVIRTVARTVEPFYPNDQDAEIVVLLSIS